MRRQHNRNSYNHLTASFPGQPVRAGTRKVKPIWILLKQETVSGSGISWAICKSAPRSRQTTTPAPHHSVVTGRMPFLPPNQQCQSTEGTASVTYKHNKNIAINTKRVCVEPPHLGCQHNVTRRCSSGACGYRYAGAASCRCRSTG